MNVQINLAAIALAPPLLILKIIAQTCPQSFG